MALISCPECNKKVSDKSAMCIECGYPLDKIIILKCTDCGAKLSDTAISCPECGCPTDEVQGINANKGKREPKGNLDISATVYNANDHTDTFRRNNAEYTGEFIDVIAGGILGAGIFYISLFVDGHNFPAKHFIQLVLLASTGAYIRYAYNRNKAIFPAIIGFILGVVSPLIYIFTR